MIVHRFIFGCNQENLDNFITLMLKKLKNVDKKKDKYYNEKF